jgi:hypothetical protein
MGVSIFFKLASAPYDERLKSSFPIMLPIVPVRLRDMLQYFSRH